MSIRKVKTALSARRLSQIERKRIDADLGVLAERIRCGEYRNARFVHNVLNADERARELVDDLRFFYQLGKVWQRIFSAGGIGEQASLLDIGCGWFPKIEVGLHHAGFRGTVTLLDKGAGTLRNARQFLDFLAVKFRCRFVESDLKRARGRFDVIAANHLLDDLLLDEYIRRTGVSAKMLYADETAYRNAWNSISHDETLTDVVADALSRRIASLTRLGGVVCLFDYISHSHRALGLETPWKKALQLSRCLKVRLCEQGFWDVQRPTALRSSTQLKIHPNSLILMRLGSSRHKK